MFWKWCSSLGLLVALCLLTSCSDCGSEPTQQAPRLAIEIVSPDTKFYTNTSVTIVVSIAAPDEAPEKVELLSNGQVVAQIPETNSILWNTSSLPEGTYELVAKATHPEIVAQSAPVEMVIDRTSPTLESRVPTGSAALPTDGAIWLHFSEPLWEPNQDTLKLTKSDGESIEFFLSMHDGNKTLSLRPLQLLKARTTVQLRASNLTDLAGNVLAPIEETVAVENWGQIGAPLGANLLRSHLQLRNGPNNSLLASWLRVLSEEPTTTGTLIFSQWKNGYWTEAITSIGLELWAIKSLLVELDSSFKPTILWQSPQALHIKTWSGSEWTDFPNLPFSSNYTSFALGLNGNEDPVVGLVESGECSQIKLYEWSNDRWNSIPSPVDDCIMGEVAISADESGLSVLLQTPKGVSAHQWSDEWSRLGSSTVHPPVLRHAAHPEISAQMHLNRPRLVRDSYGVLKAIFGKRGKITAFEFISGQWHPIGLGEINFRQEQATARPVALGFNSPGHAYGIFTDLSPQEINGSSTRTYFRFKAEDDWKFTTPLNNGTFLDGLVTPEGAVLAALLTPENTLVVQRYNPAAPIEYPPSPDFGNSTCGPFDGEPDDSNSDFPKTLTQTGCYLDVQAVTPAAGAIAYAPTSTLWTDAAIKRRYVFLPTADSQIEYRDLDSWVFPVGTIIMKEFLVHSNMKDPRSALIPMETRFLVRKDSTTWKGYSYQWNPLGTDGLLRADQSGTVEWTVTNSPGSNATTHEHFYPSRSECFQCHDGIDADKVALGLKTAQLNSWHPQSGSSENQLSFLHRNNLINQFPTSAALIPSSTPSPYNSAQSIDTRIKSYLHGNCSHCHFDTQGTCGDHRFDTPLSESGICNQVEPGHPANSPLYSRSTITEFGMPPLGRLRIDPQLEALFSAWISQLETCE